MSTTHAEPRCDQPVIYILPYLEFGGTEYHVLQLAQSIRWRRPPLVVAPDGPLRGRFENTGVQVLTFENPTRNWWTGIRSFREAVLRALRRIEADRSSGPPILHVHTGADLLWLAHRWVPRGRFIFTDHGYFGQGAELSYRVAAWILRRTRTRVIAVSRHQQSIWTRKLGLAGEQVVVVYNGVPDPLDRMPQSFTLPFSGEKDSGKVNDNEPPARLIGTVARLAPQKGIDFLIDAFSDLVQSFPYVRLFIAGDGPQRTALEKRISERPPLRHRVYLAGWVPDASSLMRHFHIYCHPSLAEALPLAIIEAMASRCAVIATRVGAVSELIEDGASGLLVPPADAGSLRRAIELLLRNETLRARLGENARRRYEQHFTVQKMASAVVALYQNAYSAADWNDSPSFTLPRDLPQSWIPGPFG